MCEQISYGPPGLMQGRMMETVSQEQELFTARLAIGLAQGLAYKQIADRLGVSIHTVRNYIRRIYEKLHVQSRTEAVAKYLSQ